MASTEMDVHDLHEHDRGEARRRRLTVRLVSGRQIGPPLPTRSDQHKNEGGHRRHRFHHPETQVSANEQSPRQ